MAAILPSRVPRHLRRGPGPITATRWVARWLRGSASLALRYPFEAVPPSHRAMPAPSAVPQRVLDRDWPGDPTTVQSIHAGVGPLYHRRYWVDVVDAELTADQLVDRLLHDVNAVAPASIGAFLDGDRTPIRDLEVGKDFLVALPGPWNAPVRVAEVTDDGFTLITLSGHIEAGQIEFRVGPSPDRATLRFQIESWARSSAALLHLFYDVVPIVREVQLVMWSRMCRNVAEAAGGTAPRGVQVRTERRPWPPQDVA